jgi:hypothetical protein
MPSVSSGKRVSGQPVGALAVLYLHLTPDSWVCRMKKERSTMAGMLWGTGGTHGEDDALSDILRQKCA